MAGEGAPDPEGGRGPDGFNPALRGWAALHLVALAPEEVRRAIRQFRCRDAARASFRQDAVGLVSRPEHIAWSRRLAECSAAAGVAAGPACVARLWAASLVRPGGGLESYWQSLVADVWQAVAPALPMLGFAVRGAWRDELIHEVAAPLALVALRSLAAGRRDLRLLEADADGPDGPPFGWAPGMDSWTATLRYLLLGQVPNCFRSHALIASPLARLLRQSGLAVAVTLTVWTCPRCGTGRGNADAGLCRHCGSGLVPRKVPRILARQRLEWAGSAFEPGCGRPRAEAGVSAPLCRLAVPERVEALEARRQCVGRARDLWQAVVQGDRHGLVTMLVLGAMAGVRPLGSVVGCPPRREWLEQLVEALAEARLEREPIAARVNRALEASTEGEGVRQRVRAAHVGVLAMRFRRAVFHRRSLL